MKPLSIGVAVAAAFALVTGVSKGGDDVLGFAADPASLSIAAIGLILAFRALRSPLISPFLRVFSTIFAIEYIMTAVAYVAVRVGWWPPGLSELAPPASLAATVAFFGLLVHLISFIPVIRQITRLADVGVVGHTEALPILPPGLKRWPVFQGAHREGRYPYLSPPKMRGR